MYKVLVLAALAAITSICQAATVTLNWTNPILRERGEELDPDDIRQATVKYDCGYMAGEEYVIGANTWSKDMVGDCEFWLTVTDTTNQESADSNRERILLRPNAPSNLRISE